MCHMGLTTAVLTGAKLARHDLSVIEIVAVYVGGVLLDSDKVFEIFEQKILGRSWDLTARYRILHSFLAFLFGFFLVWFSDSWLLFLALLLHIGADSFIPAITAENEKRYPCHAPLKWVMLPFFKSLWYKVVPIGWPLLTYTHQFNKVNKLGESAGLVLFILSCTILFI